MDFCTRTHSLISSKYTDIDTKFINKTIVIIINNKALPRYGGILTSLMLQRGWTKTQDRAPVLAYVADATFVIQHDAH